MHTLDDISGYKYGGGSLNPSHAYLLPKVTELLVSCSPATDRRIFELGCGNGSVAEYLSDQGYVLTGIDASAEGIAVASQVRPQVDLHQASAYDDLPRRFGQFPVVLSLEVVEHLYSPRAFARNVYGLLAPGGTAIVSTPFHGYWKNLAMAITGTLDQHFTALWDHGHIKFWSIRTLSTLLREAGFEDIVFHRVGRVPALAKSMIAVARRRA